MKTITTGIVFYQMLTKHIELPQMVDNLKITLTTEEFSKMIVNGEEIDIEEEKAIAIYQEMEVTYELPKFTKELEIIVSGNDAAVMMKFESILMLKDE